MKKSDLLYLNPKVVEHERVKLLSGKLATLQVKV